jgi:hypothetical protein
MCIRLLVALGVRHKWRSTPSVRGFGVEMVPATWLNKGCEDPGRILGLVLATPRKESFAQIAHRCGVSMRGDQAIFHAVPRLSTTTF